MFEFVFQPLPLTASAAKSGAGGTINITNPSALTVAGANLLVTAKGTGAFNGGTINLSNIGQITLTGTLSADGAGTGAGGNITLAQTGANTMTLDGSIISADAGTTGDGVGGTTMITSSNSGVTTSATTLNAKGTGDGKGGSITINGITSTDLSQTTISAIAGANGIGKGGMVSVLQASGAANSILNVNAQIKVDAGSGANNTVADGSIALSGVTCGQWKTGNGNSWPYTYWDCVSPGTGATGVGLASAASTLEPGLLSILGNLGKFTPGTPRVQIYAMSIDNSYQKYFGRPIANNVGEYGISNAPTRVSASFVNVYNSGGAQVTSVAYSGSTTIVQGTIVHELAHELDYTWAYPSRQAAWTSLRNTGNPADFVYMNGQPCNSVFVAASNYCANSPAMTNSQIFLFEYPAFVDPQPDDPTGGDTELYAAVFEHYESQRTIIQPNPPTYAVDPWLEQPLGFLPNMNQYMQTQNNNPPPAQQ